MTDRRRAFLIGWGLPVATSLAFAVVIVMSAWLAAPNMVWVVAARRCAHLLLSPAIVLLARRVPFDEPAWMRMAKLTGGALLLLSAYEAVYTSVTANSPFELALDRLDVYLTIALIVLTRACAAAELERDGELRQARIAAKLSIANLELLDSQLRPHFIFNTLNGVMALMADDAAAAKHLVRELREFLDTAFAGGTGSIPLHEELSLVQRYINIQMIRFGDQLRVAIDAEPSTHGRAVPRMLLQPIIENAIRYGAPGEISIRARLAGNELRIEVANHAAAPASKGMGIGLENARARLAAAFPSEASLAVRDDGAGIWSVQLVMPGVEA